MSPQQPRSIRRWDGRRSDIATRWSHIVARSSDIGARSSDRNRTPRACRRFPQHRHVMGALQTLVVVALLADACASPVGDAGPLPSPSAAPGSTAPATGPVGSPAPSGPPPTGSAPPSPAAFPTSGPTPSPSYPAATAFSVYLISGETLVPVHRQVPHTVAVARAAMDALLAGPTAVESTGPGGLLSLVPQGTALLDISLAGGVVTVDLTSEFESGGGSASMFGRLAQVVYTLTQFPSVRGVLFRLDGQPVTVFSGEGIVLEGPSVRGDYRDYVPAILLERPDWGAALPSPARLTGLANVFEAQFVAEIATSDGTVLASENVRASCGTGCWGTFDVTIPYLVQQPRPGFVTVYDLSPRDGTRENVRSYPVTLTPA